jgi:hypothetical protein
LAFRLREESTRLGYRLSVETFPAQGFATTFFEAVARNDAPDVLVFNNFGVMDGITTGLGRFEGIGRDQTLRQHFVKVTGAFDELLGPERGWTYLFALSPNYTVARMLALQAPQCRTHPQRRRCWANLADSCPTLRRRTSKGTPSVFRRTPILIDFRREKRPGRS